MKKSKTIFGAILFASFILTGCGNNNPKPDEKNRIIKEYKDSIALVEKSKQDSIDAIVPEVKVRIYERTGISYDSEGWAVSAGTVKEVKDFQITKNYKARKEYDYIQRVEIEGQSKDITIQFLDGNNKIVHNENSIELNGIKKYTTSNPNAEKDRYYLEALYKIDCIKIMFKGKVLFEGKTNCKKQYSN